MMMRIPTFLLAMLAGLLVTTAARAAPLWAIDAASRLGFIALQQGQPVDGHFADFQATIAFADDDLAGSRIAVEIDTASVATGHADRDLALRSPAFFGVEQWPTAEFVSDEIVDRGDGTYEARGRLRIRDVTTAVVLPFQLIIDDDPEDASRLVARATGELTISRLAHGVGQGDFASTQTIGDEVVIRIELVANRPR